MLTSQARPAIAYHAMPLPHTPHLGYRQDPMAVKQIAVERVVRIPLDWTLAPERAALLVRDDPYPFALIGRWAGGGALVGSQPIAIASPDADPFALLDDQPSIPPDCTAGVVGGGWFGWLGYELGRRVERIDPSPPPISEHPQFQLAFYDHVLRLDDSGQWWFEALWSERRSEPLADRLRELKLRATTSPDPRPFSTEPWLATPSASGHALAVEACRQRIHAGDLFQANVCVRLESRIRGEPIDLFAEALRHLRPDRAGFIANPQGAVASLSPELFLERRGNRVRSAPIKGTRAKPRDPSTAAVARAELLSSEKDRAENVMIVDLVRNDLGRVCLPGSVRVEALAQPREHAGVWHLVSEVSGSLAEGTRNCELVTAAFPPGSVSGAPKIAAMNVVAELESTARELYTGAIGFASPLAGLELSVAIRTFEFRGEQAWLGVGGGVVADSDPAAEAAECTVKATPLLEAIGGRFAAATPARRGVPDLLRLGPRPVPRPDPAAGVFETILVHERRPVHLQQHLRRIWESVQTLYREELPTGLKQELLAAASELEAGRLRVDVRPGDHPQISVSPLPVRASPVILCPVTVPGGIGCHKWSDRRLLSAIAERVAGEPLLLDLDGHVLESARATVFVVEDGARVLTPPTDGRILPGVTRSAVIELARGFGLEVREQPIDLEQLARAREVFLTGSLRGVDPAVVEGAAASAPTPVSETLARAWRASLPGSPTPASETTASPA
jgi:para-aminobenzoate synthetase/4-amino-4-deoxychorismate lyase